MLLSLNTFWFTSEDWSLLFPSLIQQNQRLKDLEGKRRSWGCLVCSAWRKDEYKVPSLKSTASSRKTEEAERLVSSLWWSVTGHEEMEWSCTKGSSDWSLRKGFPLRGWMITGKVSLGMWIWQQACQSSRSIWLVPLGIWFSSAFLWFFLNVWTYFEHSATLIEFLFDTFVYHYSIIFRNWSSVTLVS